MSSSLCRKVAVWLTFLLVVGTWVVTGCGSSEPADVAAGPGMLYFYAEW